ncbi:uncharacterized protein PHACADRAFT_173790 [Phanerochaete carnosa HHB-10118-sp]|uniref:UFSP1/2/DUB catalytic domain-containing protein n=1 Tax=Phanerochaete carnosa (strain HHB-10118-sp) TaxID=650164 RepID=K5UZM5_PHACS|nr:uncharacterized protein PHACADRAFT_173790 [Phanerochaete carnosa HHB-10118-sp]EKM55631.1 hypothetical protein PHACADRAFT_173790 [Phanerochaete carnosa HHB-10118-sp]
MNSSSNTPNDDVEFLYEQKGPFLCQVCGLELVALPEQQRADHHNEHFSGKAQGSSSATPKPKSPSLKPGQPLKRKWKASDDAFWHPAQDDPPPLNFTPGLIPLLKKALVKAHAKGAVERAYLCSDVAVHVQTESFDRGWGCGYRNFLMSCAALMGQQLQPMYFPLLDAPISPGVRNLQQWIEDAWSRGFDEEGRDQLKQKLTSTRKWIGTGELYVAFSSRGIPVNLVDFQLHERGIEALIRWIVDYFTQDVPRSTNINDALKAASPVVITDKMPIVLQHSGHSRTVVGYEKLGNKIQLLIFDPGRYISPDIRRAALAKRGGSNAATNPPQKAHFSPKKLFKRVLHPHTNNGGNFAGDRQQAKRIRAGDVDDIIVVNSDSEGEGPSQSTSSRVEEVDLAKVLKTFRLSASSLAKKDKYQILYFPMTAPLSDSERLQRRVVTSKKIGY